MTFEIKSCKKFCTPLLAALILLLTLAYITLPSIRYISSLSQQIFDERKKLEELYQKGQSLRESKQEYERVKNQVKLLDNVFVTPGRELDFITQLEQKSMANNLVQKIDIQTKKLASAGQTKKLPVQIGLQGTYFDILNYLQDVESLDFYLNIESLSFSKQTDLTNLKKPDLKSDSKNIEPLITAELEGYVYYYLNPPSP